MKKVIIGDYQFEMKSEWGDLLLSDFVALCQIKMPEKLVNLYKNAEDKEKWNGVFDSITFEDNEKLHPEYYGQVIKLLSNIPQSIIDLIDAEQRTELFNQYLFPFAFSSITDYPVVLVDGKSELYQPKEIKHVNFKGAKYYFPESLKIRDLETPLAKESIISFTEASGVITAWNKLSEGGAEYAALIPAIYLRKKGEKYDEQTVLERSKIFTELTMDVVWSLFFYTIKLAGQSLNDTLLSLTANETTKSRRLLIKVE
jgi:hypothetical protein